MQISRFLGRSPLITKNGALKIQKKKKMAENSKEEETGGEFKSEKKCQEIRRLKKFC